MKSIPYDVVLTLLSYNIYTWNDNVPMWMGPGPNPYQRFLHIDKEKFAVGQMPLHVMRNIRRKAKLIHARKPEFTDFFVRLVRFGKISSTDMTYAAGKYYGYPTCCIKHFIACELKQIPVAMFMSANYGTDTADVEYVRCPTCRKLNR